MVGSFGSSGNGLDSLPISAGGTVPIESSLRMTSPSSLRYTQIVLSSADCDSLHSVRQAKRELAF